MNEVLTIEKNEFDVHTLDDEIRVDALCSDILHMFYRHLLEKNIPEAEATSLASGADYFTRDFVVARRQKNILDAEPGIVRQFAGNWYITNTLEPNIRELSSYLGGVRAFYAFLNDSGLISDELLLSIEKECDNLDYYKARIDSFWEIRGDGYFEWERECTLKDN